MIEKKSTTEDKSLSISFTKKNIYLYITSKKLSRIGEQKTSRKFNITIYS